MLFKVSTGKSKFSPEFGQASQTVYLAIVLIGWKYNGAVSVGIFIRHICWFSMNFPLLARWQKSIDKHFLHGVTGFMVNPTIQNFVSLPLSLSFSHYFLNNENNDNEKNRMCVCNKLMRFRSHFIYNLVVITSPYVHRHNTCTLSYIYIRSRKHYTHA